MAHRKYVCIEDFRKEAGRRLPKIFADYVEGGSFSETTLKRNVEAFSRYALSQRVLTGLSEPDLSTHYLGATQALPFFPGPVGFLGLYRRDGDLHVGLSAKQHGVPFVLSSFSIRGIRSLAPLLGETLNFQLYIDREETMTARHLKLCRDAGVQTIFLTVDTAVTSVRERDVRNGFREVTHITPSLFAQFARRPGWALDILRNGLPNVEFVSDLPEFGKGALAQASALSRRLEKNLTWDKVKWLRNEWKGRLIIKGISDARDAALARDVGADGIVLSNHGGRQIDYGRATIMLVSEMRQAMGDAMDLFVDGGFRRGSDIIKAIALGADAVMLGRAFAWAVAAEGRAGVDEAFRMLSAEITSNLQLMGVSTVAELKARRKAETFVIPV